jgi:SHS family lactate transporter-like MFS transporter
MPALLAIIVRARVKESEVSMVGVIIGGVVCGRLSDHFGRRRIIGFSLVAAICVTPLGAYAPNVPLFTLQFMVRGAWEVIPAHVTEPSVFGAEPAADA